MKPFLLLLLSVASCHKSPTQPIPPATGGFEDKPSIVAVRPMSVPEASGIADSKINPGYLWVEQDSGNPPLIFLLNHDGTIADSVLLQGATNRDWEDIALASGKLYIGDIGDNNAVYPDCSIYRMTEPMKNAGTISDFETIRFKYPDGARDAEAFLVDGSGGDIFVITKRDAKSRVYRLSYPQRTDTINEAQFLMELPFSGVVSAAMSGDGKEIILKTYSKLYYYTKPGGEDFPAVLAKTPVELSYMQEAQGEAVSFAIDNSGFYTLGEEALGIVPALNFYKRK